MRGFAWRRIITALALYLLFAAPVSALTITLHDAEVTDRRLTIGDIARISGVSSAHAGQIAAIEIGQAPNAGARSVIRSNTVRMHVLAKGFAPEEVDVRGGNILVHRTGQMVPGAELERAILDRLTRFSEPGTKFTLSRVPGNLVVPAGSYTIEIDDPREIRKSFSVNASVFVGNEHARFFVSVQAERYTEALVATTTISRGDLLGPDNIGIREENVYDLRSGWIGDPAVVLGKVATRSISADQLILQNAFETEKVVKRGDRVRIQAKIGGLVVSAVGEALGTGALGESIRVRNAKTNKILQARVAGSGEVMIDEI